MWAAGSSALLSLGTVIRGYAVDVAAWSVITSPSLSP